MCFVSAHEQTLNKQPNTKKYIPKQNEYSNISVFISAYTDGMPVVITCIYIV